MRKEGHIGRIVLQKTHEPEAFLQDLDDVVCHGLVPVQPGAPAPGVCAVLLGPVVIRVRCMKGCALPLGLLFLSYNVVTFVAWGYIILGRKISCLAIVCDVVGRAHPGLEALLSGLAQLLPPLGVARAVFVRRGAFPPVELADHPLHRVAEHRGKKWTLVWLHSREWRAQAVAFCKIAGHAPAQAVVHLVVAAVRGGPLGRAAARGVAEVRAAREVPEVVFGHLA
mmetsp:Transcript_21368/g.35353  ORF Transcript_21368/g.35353 Transcript_21368/m.35353 type:complete len:225 (+) Transcript_21368:639-1313(+)